MEKKIKLTPENIDGKWYVVGNGLKMSVPTKGHATAIAHYLMNVDITNPNFTPGRRKKSL
jgi:hypothetical protein